MKYSDVVSAFKNGDVVEFQIDKNNLLTLELREGSASAEKWGVKNSQTGKYVAEYRLASLSIFHADLGDDIEDQIAAGTLKGEYVAPTQYPAWVSYIPILLVVVGMIILYVVMTRQMTGSGGGGMGKMANFSKARAKMADSNDKNKVTFRDVAGADEEKQELEEVVEFLKAPQKFAKLGAKIPHGVLLMGPPGTGKTLLAKAVAGEAGVPFFSISGSDFVEMYVGVGASRVRDLFDTARKAPASIVFIDEIDAVGRHRGAGLGGGHDEREQTLNQLLVEMDGFGSHDGIIVIAATNRPDILDPALLRPGRFDRQITVNYPDINGRIEILKVHSRNKPLESEVDFREVAKMTVGFTGADLANLLNEAALLATRRNKSLIGMEDISDAFIRIIAGPKKKARAMKESEKKKTAYHEAGHAMIAYHLDLDPVQQISIIPSGRALGYTLNPPKEDKYSEYKSELVKEISMLLGGRAAEEIIYKDVTGGASNDIERATKIAKRMITRLGMSDVLGPRCFGTDQNEVFLGRDFSSSQDYSEEIAAKIDQEMHDIIQGAYQKAKDILIGDIQKLHFIAEFLLRNEIMDGDQFRAVMESECPVIEEIEAIAEAKKQKSLEANKARADAEEKARREAQEKIRTAAQNNSDNLQDLKVEEPENKDQAENNQ
ncbi:MAG: ATP-dependent zinc metalloprotease FtsH [Ruminococcaceae bacterium]|nr:ATP-dependent zinc metalloprotease FtsH [Oscillospiraceae bacterium]